MPVSMGASARIYADMTWTRLKRGRLLWACAVLLALPVLGAAALAIGGLRGLVALALVWLATLALARWWTRDLGGLTGDTYGALCEIAEVVTLATLAVRI